MALIKKYELFFLFLFLIPVLLLRMNVEQTKYCTPDSVYYLEVSQNILSGYGAVGPKAFDYNKNKTKIFPLYDKTAFGRPDLYEKEYFAIWPLGYPACIVSVAYITQLSPLWSSKVVNILLLALSFYILFLLFDGTSILPMYYFGSYTMLEICSYTWSENLYLPFFLLFILSIRRIHESEVFSIKNMLLLSLSIVSMCLARYASIVFFAIASVFLLYYFNKGQYEKAKVLFSSLLLSAIVFGSYLLNNYWRSGYMTGMPRVNTQDFTPLELFEKLYMGLFNQLHLIKQFRFSGTADFAFYLVLVFIQLALIYYIAKLLIKNDAIRSISFINKVMLGIAFFYLIFLIYMTFTSTIDPFDYRTLLPFSFPLMIALLFEVEVRLVKLESKYALLSIKAFFIFSMFMNLPKFYIIGLIF